MRTLIAILITIVVFAGVSFARPQETAPGLLMRIFEVEPGLRALPVLAAEQVPNEVRIIPTINLGSSATPFGSVQDHFVTEVVGYLTVKDAGRYEFQLTSDDGSRLWIDGALIVNHDGPHSATPKDGDVELAAGRHALRVLHYEGNGEESLTLRWQPPGDKSKFQFIPLSYLTHDANAPRDTVPGTKKVIPALRQGLPGDGTRLASVHPGVRFTSKPPASSDLNSLVTSGTVREIAGRGLPDFNKAPVAWVPLGTRLGQPLGEWDRYGKPSQWLIGAEPDGECFRIAHETIGSTRQGVAFRFSTPPDGPQPQSIQPTDKTVFEISTVRALSNGFEIEFTKPLDPRCGWDPKAYLVEQWPFGGENKGGGAAQPKLQQPHRDGVVYPVLSSSVSPDRKTVFLELGRLKESHVVYIRFLPPCYSQGGERLWSTEAWYTLNAVPTDRHGKPLPSPAKEPQNILTAEEKAAGWTLLFDGQTTSGWRGYRKDRFPDGWVVEDDCLARVGSGGDIITESEYDDFELKLEWRISPAGNSGIFFRVDEKCGWPWETGPEMQVLDNAEHHDGRNPKTSAGSSYALYAPEKDVTQPVGFFNQVHIIVKGAHVEYWFNGVKVVDYVIGSPQWRRRVAASTFRDLPNYGQVKKGHIVLQDHGDKVWYRNIKIRPLSK